MSPSGSFCIRGFGVAAFASVRTSRTRETPRGNASPCVPKDHRDVHRGPQGPPGSLDRSCSMLNLVLAWLAGVVTIAAPCTLPMLPILLGASVGQTGKIRPAVIALGFVLFDF